MWWGGGGVCKLQCLWALSLRLSPCASLRLPVPASPSLGLTGRLRVSWHFIPPLVTSYHSLPGLARPRFMGSVLAGQLRVVPQGPCLVCPAVEARPLSTGRALGVGVLGPGIPESGPGRAVEIPCVVPLSAPPLCAGTLVSAPLRVSLPSSASPLVFLAVSRARARLRRAVDFVHCAIARLIGCTIFKADYYIALTSRECKKGTRT